MSFKSLKYFTLFCFLFLHDYARAQDFKFWHLDSKNGLPSATVNVLLQDYQGFMWIGAIDGLYKYDGYGFKPFKFRQADKEGLWGSNISLLYEDSRQTLWIGTTGKGLHYYDKNQEKVIRLAKTEGMYINALKEDKNGELWLSNNGLLGKLDLKNLSFNNQITNELKEKLPTKLINDFVIVNPHEFWIGTADEGLFFLNLKTQEVQQFKNLPENPNTLSSNHIKKLYLDKEQILWVGTREGGLCKFDTKKREFQLFKHDPNDSLSIGSNTIFDIAEINNQLWVATDNGGLSIIDKQNKVIQKIVYQKDITTSISINNIRYIYQDAAKRIWVGTHTAGISIIDNLKNKFSTLNLFPTKQVVSAVFRDGKNRLWVGADGGLHQISESNKRKVFVHNPNQKGSLGGKSVRNITEDEKQNIWIGGWASGLNLFDEKTETFKVFMSEKENTQTLSNSNVLFIKESKKTKKLFVAAWEKLNQLEDLEKGIFRRITNQVPDNIKTEVSDIQANIMLHIGEDTEGYLWLGTYFGLHRLDPQTLEIKTFIHDDKNPNSLSSDDVLYFHQDAKGRKWIGTSVGLNLMNNDGTFTRFNTPENLTVHAILPDKKGNLWLSSANTGLYRFDTEKHTFKQFDESDGLQGKEFRHNAAFADKNGTLYFGGLQGLTYFHPDSIQENRILPKVYLTDFKIFNKSVQIGEYDSLLQKSIMQTQEITLSHEHSVFTIDFVALNFTQPEKNQYAYQLEGFDKNWNYIGNQRSTTYTNLDAGTYTFKVKASNNDGIWNEEGTKLIIRILPPWWKTWWFRGGILLSIIFSAVAYYKIQTANLKKRNLVLEQKVAERTKDLRIASEQIQEKNEELQASEEELRQNMEELEANQEFIQEQKKALEEAYHTLSIQNVRITDSIRYAKRIQGAILPHEKVLNDGFSSHFVIYKPKDVVSGDFYWYLETITSNQLSVTNENLKQPTINNQQFIKKKFLAVVDCTGHGVPGAMMSMVGSSFLKEIVQTMQIHEPSQILTELNIKISEFFENKSERFQDGMDMGLCCIEDINENEVVIKFSGAKRSLFYTENDKLHEIRGDRFSIGRPNGLDYLYRLHTLRFAKESTHLYMTTDGWIDAINEQRKRFGSQLFTEMIEESLSLSLNQQKEIFQKALNDYQQNAEQRDDILMVGVRV